MTARACRVLALLLVSLLCLLALVQQCAAGFSFDLNKTPDEQEFELAAGPEFESKAGAQSQAIERAEAKDGRPVSKARKLWAKVRERLPSYFDFDQFTSKFKRAYSNSEHFSRQSIFVERTLEVFKWRVSFRLGKVSYLRAVNRFSDRTEEELRSMFMSTKPPPSSSSEAMAEFASGLRERRIQLQLARNRLPALEMRSRGRAGASEAEQAELAVEQLLASAELLDDEEAVGAILDEVNQMSFVAKSQAAAGGAGAGAGARLGWPGAESAAEWQARTAPLAHLQAGPYQAPRLSSPEDSIDWSEHRCFCEIYQQGDNCGKCYVMAAAALAEFYKCSENPRRQKQQRFSKDFLFDCGQKFSPTLMGCAGGSPIEALRFLVEAGALTIADWRQKRGEALKRLRERSGGTLTFADPLDISCPLSAHQEPMDEWGSIRLAVSPEPVHPNLWHAALQDGPLVAWLQMPLEGLHDYAGGVHDGAGCANSGVYHAMVLVGYGTDPTSGLRFWRFRNSFGPEWGDAGHLNLNMELAEGCLVGGVRLVRRPGE